MSDTSTVNLQQLRNKVINYAQLRLGHPMVDVELDAEHYDNALDRALELFRSMSSAAHEESFCLLKTQKNIQEYTLPDEVEDVIRIDRRSVGELGDSTSTMDSFSQGFFNVYLLSNMTTGGGNNSNPYFNYELFQNQLELTKRMFGGYIQFDYNRVTKKLVMAQRPKGDGEVLLLEVYKSRNDIEILSDYRTISFIKDCTYMYCLQTLGQIREKYSSILSANGQTSLNGQSLKTEAADLYQKLMDNISNYKYGEPPLSLLIG